MLTIQHSGPDGEITTTFEYDGIQRLVRVTDTEGNVTTSTYDMGDRPHQPHLHRPTRDRPVHLHAALRLCGFARRPLPLHQHLVADNQPLVQHVRRQNEWRRPSHSEVRRQCWQAPRHWLQRRLSIRTRLLFGAEHVALQVPALRLVSRRTLSGSSAVLHSRPEGYGERRHHQRRVYKASRQLRRQLRDERDSYRAAAELEQKQQHTRVLQPQVQCGIQQKGAHDRRGDQGEEVCHGLEKGECRRGRQGGGKEKGSPGGQEVRRGCLRQDT